MDDTLYKKTITLEEIHKRKEAVKLQMDKQKNIIISSVKEAFSPTPAEKAAHPLIKKFSTGVAIFEGLMTGIKIIRKIKAIFKRKK